MDPAPLELLPVAPLPPEVSPARRSQPTAVRLSAATTNKTFDVVFNAFILVPFKKVNVVCHVLDLAFCDKFYEAFCKIRFRATQVPCHGTLTQGMYILKWALGFPYGRLKHVFGPTRLLLQGGNIVRGKTYRDDVMLTAHIFPCVTLVSA